MLVYGFVRNKYTKDSVFVKVFRARMLGTVEVNKGNANSMQIKMILAGMTLAMGMTAHAQTVCVFDVLGAQGDTYAMMKDYAVSAKQWGVDITLKPYSDERLASEDFKAGQCDGVFLTGMRTRPFNSFTGSIDSMGSIPSYSILKMTLSLMANPKLANDMISNGYEVVGVTPLGAAYIMVRDSISIHWQKPQESVSVYWTTIKPKRLWCKKWAPNLFQSI